jgi:hypothetical protein
MKPQDFVDKWLGWAKNKEDINNEILSDLDEMNQALHIHDVAVRSERYHCELYDFGRKDKPCNKQCDGCKEMNLD